MKLLFAAEHSQFLQHKVRRKINLVAGLHCLELVSTQTITEGGKNEIAFHSKSLAPHNCLIALKMQASAIDFTVVSDHLARRWLLVRFEDIDALKRDLSEAIAAPARLTFFANMGWKPATSNSPSSVDAGEDKRRSKLLLAFVFAFGLAIAILGLLLSSFVGPRSKLPSRLATPASQNTHAPNNEECLAFDDIARSLQGLSLSSLDDQGVAALVYSPDNILDRVRGVETIGGESVLFATSSCLVNQPPTETAVQINLSSSTNGWQIRNVTPVEKDSLG